MPIEWDVPPQNAARNSANMRATLIAALDQPGKVRVDQGDCDRAFASGAKIVEATYTTPYLPRARMEPGNATVLVTDDRVDIWIGDQSPQETRYSAAKITGIPEANVYLHLCHLGGGYGRNGNGPQAEQAIYIANQHRGTPIHLLWTREEDFIGSTYRAMGVARLRAALDADGFPDRARSAHRHGRDRPRARTPPSTGPRFTLRRATGSRTTSRTSTCRSARGAASAPRRMISTARAFWTNSPTRRARTPISTAAS